MIRNELFDFTSAAREAAKYRLSLRGDPRSKDLDRDIEAFLLSRISDFDRYKYQDFRFDRLARAEEFSYSLKNLSYMLYMYNVKMKTVDQVLDSFYNKTENWFKAFNKDLKLFKDQIEEASLRFNSKYNKVKVVSLFKEKDFTEGYDLVDIKTGMRFTKEDQVSFKDDSIESPLLYEQKISITKIDLLTEESFIGDTYKPIDISKDNFDLVREEKTWKYIVGKKENSIDGQRRAHRPVSVSLVIKFNGEQEINHLFIESASSLPVAIELGNLYYYDYGFGWRNLEGACVSEEYNRKQIFFNKVRTKKIKIKLTQSKYIENVSYSENSKEDELIHKSYLNKYPVLQAEENYRIYDLSLKEIKASLRINKAFGFYREAEFIPVNKPISAFMDYNLIYNDPECFIEKSLHVVLYGETNMKAFKNQQFKTPRYNKVISVPNNKYEEKEVLIFRNREAKVMLFPKIKKDINLSSSIKVYKVKNGIKTLLTMFNDYYISINEKESFEEDFLTSEVLLSKIKNKIAGWFWIKLKTTPEFEAVYAVEYILDEDFYLDEMKMLRLINGEIIFPKSLSDSVGFVRPRFIFRSESKMNESSIMSKYRVLIEEKDSDEESYIEYETFEETQYGATSNVI